MAAFARAPADPAALLAAATASCAGEQLPQALQAMVTALGYAELEAVEITSVQFSVA